MNNINCGEGLYEKNTGIDFFKIVSGTEQVIDKKIKSPEVWKGAQRQDILQHGAIVYRDFGIESIEDFEGFISSISPADPWMDYAGERASPRTHIGSNTYTSTEYSAAGNIFVHNEMCNRTTWPLRIYFGCETPAAEGGETPVCNIRKVTSLIPEYIKEEFRSRKIQYTRNYGKKLGVSIDYGFGTENRDLINEYCERNEIIAEWNSDGSLRTRAIRPAFAIHPYTREELWFNYATFYSPGSQERKFQMLIRSIKEDDRAFSVRFGDGEEISEDIFDITRQAYYESTHTFKWKKGDILAVDNMLAAHGRGPFRGERSVWVAMTEECSGDSFSEKKLSDTEVSV